MAPAQPGGTPVPRSSPPRMDTLIVTPEVLAEWQIPPFQRPLRVNDKVQALAQTISHEGGMIPGILTLGSIKKEKTLYVIDGQHRIEAAKLSGRDEMMCDVRILSFETMAEMGEEFVQSNSSLVRMRPDDILRGLEASTEALKIIRNACPFVVYGNIRRNSTGEEGARIVSMSSVIRAWSNSAAESAKSGSKGAATVAASMTDESANHLSVCLQACYAAWGNDTESSRLWSEMNLTLTMWMWRRLVMDKERRTNRYVVMTPEQFRRCLMTVSASSDYLDWLVGRGMNEKNRTPCYTRLKALFAARLKTEGVNKAQLPQPAWSVSRREV